MSPAETQLEAGTAKKLLEAASAVFAERGFRDSTVREICQRAGANLAAVNYHYRDKEGLYRAVVDDAMAGSFALFVRIAGDQGAVVKSPGERLGEFVRNVAQRMLDEGPHTRLGQIMLREMIEPTGVLDQFVHRFIRPQMEHLQAIVREIVGPAAPDEAVRLAANSIIGQLLMYKHMDPVITRLFPDHRRDHATVARIADHVTRFSLAGLEGVRAHADGARGEGGSR